MEIEKNGTEQAIEAIAELRQKYARSPKTRYLMALCMADAALRAQQERLNPKPCGYCENVPSRYKAIRAEGFYQEAVDDIYNPELEVNYCPVCGRKLEPKGGEKG
jgi:hypothetical protein